MASPCQLPVRRQIATFIGILCAFLIVYSAALAQKPSAASSSDEITWTNRAEAGYSFDARQDEGPLVDYDLIGYWEHSDAHGTVTLEVLSENKLRFTGRELRYQIVPGAIRVTDECGELDYPYQLVGDSLVLTMSDEGERPMDVTFHRVHLSNLKDSTLAQSAWHKRQKSTD